MAEGFRRGGSIALARLIDEYGAALVADFRAVYGMDLVAELHKLMSNDESAMRPRHIFVLVEGLPIDCNFGAAIQGGKDARGWSREAYILADVWDVTAAAAMAGSKQKPPRYPRPGGKKAAKPNSLSMAEMIQKQLGNT